MLRELNGHQQDVTGCMFLNQPGGAGEGKGEEDLPSTIVSVSKDMTLRTWNAATGEPCQVHSEGQSGQFTHLAAAAPGSTATCYVTSIENGVFVMDWWMFDRDPHGPDAQTVSASSFTRQGTAYP